MSYLPEGFYHHAPQLHLTFMCLNRRKRRLDLVTADCETFEEGLGNAAENMRENGWDLAEDPMVFLGYAV